ncbi:hypothetical protein NB720_004154 [Pantoea ananatis]|nr:hypothetical protein [Pantoea ananatis]MCW0409964.1 hypothetical protein [Pantoea ananatis]
MARITGKNGGNVADSPMKGKSAFSGALNALQTHQNEYFYDEITQTSRLKST